MASHGQQQWPRGSLLDDSTFCLDMGSCLPKDDKKVKKKGKGEKPSPSGKGQAYGKWHERTQALAKLVLEGRRMEAMHLAQLYYSG